MEKVTKIIMKRRYSPISGITWDGNKTIIQVVPHQNIW